MIKELLYKWFDLEPLPCQSCETLKLQLSIANHEKQELLNTILSFSKPPAREETTPAVEYEKVKPKMMTWTVRKQMLEAEDRRQAELLADQRRRNEEASKIKDDIDKLEKELDIPAEAPNA